MKHHAIAYALSLGALLAVPLAAQLTKDGFAIRDGMVIGKRIEEGYVILDLFGTSGDGLLEVLTPLAQPGTLLTKACDMVEVGDVASMWDGLAPDPASDFPTLYRLTSVTIGHHGSQFAVRGGEVTGKRMEDSHVILDLSSNPAADVLQALCPLDQPGDLLAETCNMVEIGDVAYLWDGLAPDQASDFPTLLRLTSVTIGTPMNPALFADGFESGNMLAWPSINS